MQFMRGCEVQDGKRRTDRQGRLGLHDHVILRTGHALDERQIRHLAIQADYGHSISLDDVRPDSSREAAYLSKYVSKSADVRWRVPWRTEVVNVETGEVTGQLVKARYRTWSASRRWGLTMKQLHANAAIRAHLLQPVEAGNLAVTLLTRALGAVEAETGQPPPMTS